ncbi:MAG: ClpXP protease specificity-enhancing factor SspB [Minwuia sp.]|nr:ClpXP protease specificity-enhancing factor SspB [Minwuia sp.]
MKYAQMVEDALRGVVRRALHAANTEGLHGNHHFYVTFLTRFPGVELPDHLLERYEHDMTIVLQHQYWDLKVEETFFEVSLSFNKLPTRIHVPYAAVTSFADPSVQFGLQFEPQMDQIDGESVVPAGNAFAPMKVPEESGDAEVQEAGEGDEGAPEEKAGEVVSLDAFRKKS